MVRLRGYDDWKTTPPEPQEPPSCPKCHEYVVNEICANCEKEENEMSLAEQLKAELMERYGLREDQVRLEVIFYTSDIEQGRQILSNFDRSEVKRGPYFDEENMPCDHVYGNEVDSVFVHRRDGFYSHYVTEEAENE